MYTAGQIFGVTGDELSRLDARDPQTPATRTFVGSGAATLEPPDSWRAITDPKGSAIFWIAAAAILGLVLVTGQLKVEAALGGRAGKR